MVINRYIRNNHRSYQGLALFVCLFLIFSVASSTAGNKDMVENRTQEMDELNKQMVGQIPNLPKDGKVDAKARVTNEGGGIIFDVYQVKTVVKEESLNFGGGERQETESNEAPIPNSYEKKKPSVSKSK
jgi:hypothetical protein